MWWMVATAAWAADPDLSGVHLALGGGLQTSLGAFTEAAPPMESSVRLHLGPAWIAEISAAGGRFRERRRYEDFEQDEEGELALDRLDDYDMTGWRASGGLRLQGRIRHRDGIDAYLGVAASRAVSNLSGPLLRDIPDAEGLTLVPAEVGTEAETRHLTAVSASFTAVHWATERIAVSGRFELPVYSLERRIETSDVEIPLLETSRDEYHDESFGGAPIVGLWVHLRL